jgi:DNA-binding transcriptional MerR regulator
MKIARQKLRIGELATKLNVETFVIRFWEKEFNIKGSRSQGGQRCYNAQDAHKFNIIKSLLYEHGFTIAGAKKYIQEHRFKKITSPVAAPEQGRSEPNIIASSLTTMDSQPAPLQQVTNSCLPCHKLNDLKPVLTHLKTELIKLKRSLASQ